MKSNSNYTEEEKDKMIKKEIAKLKKIYKDLDKDKFNTTQEIGIGESPDAIHFSDNSIMLFYINDGKLYGSKFQPPEGNIDWGNISFSNSPKVIAKDILVSNMRLKSIPRLGVYGVWKTLEPTERHRFAIYENEIDISKYLNNGSFELKLNSPVVELLLSFQNPDQILIGESTSKLNPGFELDLKFQAGDSEPYPLGKYYIDRSNFEVTSDSISVQGRNISGKLLKDQTVDDNNIYTKKPFAQNVIELLENAGVENFNVQTGGTWELGMEFPPNTTFYDALLEFIKLSKNWKVIEDLDGTIVAGSVVTFPDIQKNSKCTFYRDSDVWSRGIVRDDNNVYSRVCVHDVTFAIKVYQDIEKQPEWSIANQKTLYVLVPEGTPIEETEDLALELSERIERAGTLETFIGAFRPQLLPGDEAEIITNQGTKLLGVITNIKHKFGKSGFITEFTVDSGGVIGKPMISDYISQITQMNKNKGMAKRLY